MKNKLIYVAVSILVVFGAAMIIKAQTNRNNTIGDAEITKAKASFAALAKTTFKDLGLKSAEEINALTVGYQMTRYMITLDDVRKFKEGTDPETLIKPLEVTDVILVNAAGEMVTSMEFTKGKEGSVVSGYGFTPAQVSLARAASIIGPEKLKVGRFVDIPALHVSFIVVMEEKKLHFISVNTDENARLKMGESMDAAAVLAALAPIANAYNGLPQ